MNQYFHSLKYAAHWFASGVKLAKKTTISWESAGRPTLSRTEVLCDWRDLSAKYRIYRQPLPNSAKGALPPEFLS